MGRGLRAAVAMGELRTAVRTLALLDLEPAEVLSALDEVARGLGAPGSRRTGPRPRPASSRPREPPEPATPTSPRSTSPPASTRSTTRSPGAAPSPTPGHLPPVAGRARRSGAAARRAPGHAARRRRRALRGGRGRAARGRAARPLHRRPRRVPRPSRWTRASTPSAAPSTSPRPPLEDVCDHVLTTLDTAHGEDDIALLMARVQGLPADAVGDWTLAPRARARWPAPASSPATS